MSRRVSSAARGSQASDRPPQLPQRSEPALLFVSQPPRKTNVRERQRGRERERGRERLGLEEVENRAERKEKEAQSASVLSVI